MWKQTSSPQTPTPVDAAPRPAPPREAPPREASPRDLPQQAAKIGKSVVINGTVIGSEDLTIDGRVEGRVELRGHSLLIGPNAEIRADLFAETITIMGNVVGKVTATDKVDIRMSAAIEGDIDAPKVVVAEGAGLRGKIDTLTQAKSARQPLAIAV